MKSIFYVTPKGAWYRGEITVRYNLGTIVKYIGFLIVLPILIALFACEYLIRGFKLLFEAIGTFGRWLSKMFDKMLHSAAFIALCGAVIVICGAIGEWIKKNYKKILTALALLLVALFAYRSCSADEKEEEDYYFDEVVYHESFNKVVIARAYLDGVQESVSNKCPRALVGFKFINGQTVADKDFSGLTYDEAVKVIADDWSPVIENYLKVKLSEQKFATLTLVAMRMGREGFARSTFLKKVNQGLLDEAADYLYLEDSNGNKRKVGEEPTQYFYILRLLWTGEICIDELVDYPMFSYKNINVKEMTDDEGHYIFNEEIYHKLVNGSNPNPREALEL